MKNLRAFFLAAIACLTLASGTRAQEYEWSITYPPADSSHYDYLVHAVDCWGEVSTAVATRLGYGTSDIFINVCIRSTDGGQTWKEQSTGIPGDKGSNGSELRGVQQIDSLNAVAWGDSGILIKSTDGGNSWDRLNLNSLAPVFSANFSDSMTGIVVKSWATLPTDTSNIIVTHNGGLTWIPSSFRPWWSATMCHSDGGESFKAIPQGGEAVYSTNDDWQTFDSTAWIIPLTDTVHVVGCCNFSGTDTLVGYGSDYYEGNRDMFIIQSTNAGASWSSPNVPDSLIQYAGSMSSLDRDIVFYGGWALNNQKIAVSRDHGMTWNIENYVFNKPDTIPPWIMSLAVTQRNEGIGIFSYTGLPTSSSVLTHGVPVSSGVSVPTSESQTLSVYPNPAAQTIVISSLEAGKEVQILDVLGRSYDVPCNGSALDISSLPSGVYFLSDGRSRAKFVKE